jgi:putative FmdB family regulatory protein
VGEPFFYSLVIDCDGNGATPESGRPETKMHARRSAMPTYQYRCEKCGKIFEHVEHVEEHVAVKLKCPQCGSEALQHRPTQFFARTSKKS